MHGEGNLFAHLMIVGYKVSYKQVGILIHSLLLFSCVLVVVCECFNCTEAHHRINLILHLVVAFMHSWPEKPYNNFISTIF